MSLDDFVIRELPVIPDQNKEYVIATVLNLADGEHTFSMELLNKDLTQDTVLNEDGNIVEDLGMDLIRFELDQIDLTHLVRQHCHIQLTQPVSYKGQIITELTDHLNLSWNGKFTYKFKTPFYQWLLEAI